MAPGNGDYATYNQLVAGVYTHIVGTYDGARLKLFIDGKQQIDISSATSLTAAPVSFMIGASNGAPNHLSFNGSIDEAAIYDYALAPDRIDVHYRVGIGQL